MCIKGILSGLKDDEITQSFAQRINDINEKYSIEWAIF